MILPRFDFTKHIETSSFYSKHSWLLLETSFNRKILNVLTDRRARAEHSSNELQRCIRMLRFAWKLQYCSRLSIPGKDLPSAAWCKRTSNFTSTGSRRKVDTIINLWSSSSANVFFGSRAALKKAFAKPLDCELMTY